MSLPSGPRAITTSTVAFSRPMIRSIQSPLNTPGLPQSKPSSSRNRTVSSRSSTTRPMWTKLVTPGRWLSTEVKPDRVSGVLDESVRREPVLLGQRDRDAVTELDQFWLGERGMQALPEGVIRAVGIPGDRVGPGERGALTLVVACGVVRVGDDVL